MKCSSPVYSPPQTNYHLSDNMRELKPPTFKFILSTELSIFLAGSIEMGTAERWQDRVTERIAKHSGDIVVFNPRRDDWDSSWVQEMSNPQFYRQVSWEQTYLDIADIVIFYFAPGTQSPISLLELGHRIGVNDMEQQILVACPVGFWRKGNVDIMCSQSGTRVFDSLDALMDHLDDIIPTKVFKRKNV